MTPCDENIIEPKSSIIAYEISTINPKKLRRHHVPEHSERSRSIGVNDFEHSQSSGSIGVNDIGRSEWSMTIPRNLIHTQAQSLRSLQHSQNWPATIRERIAGQTQMAQSTRGRQTLPREAQLFAISAHTPDGEQ
jgi:hypothetical protein